MGDTSKSATGQTIDDKPDAVISPLPIDDTIAEQDKPLRTMTDYIILPFTFWVATTGAATAANYSPVLNVAFPMVMLYAYESHGTANSGACTLQVDKLTTGQAQGDGVNMLSSGIDVTTTANTPVKYSPTATLANRQVDAGDRVEIRQPTGSLSGLADVCITLFFRVNLKDLPK